jgi:hypothetical protein
LLPSDPGGVQQELVVPACRGAKIYGIPDSGYSKLIFLFTGIIHHAYPKSFPEFHQFWIFTGLNAGHKYI